MQCHAFKIIISIAIEYCRKPPQLQQNQQVLRKEGFFPIKKAKQTDMNL